MNDEDLIVMLTDRGESNFKFDPNEHDFAFPCCICIHRHGAEDDEPCASCGHR